MIDKDRARKVRPILRWIKEGAPRKREREEAAGLLRILEGVKEYRQISLTKGQMEMLSFVYEEFPETTHVPKQLELWSPESSLGTSLDIPPYKGGQASSGPKLKTEFTEEDKSARESMGLSGLPEKVPTDTSGVPLTERISDIRQKTIKREKDFGRSGD